MNKVLALAEWTAHAINIRTSRGFRRIYGYGLQSHIRISNGKRSLYVGPRCCRHHRRQATCRWQQFIFDFWFNSFPHFSFCSFHSISDIEFVECSGNQPDKSPRNYDAFPRVSILFVDVKKVKKIEHEQGRNVNQSITL